MNDGQALAMRSQQKCLNKHSMKGNMSQKVIDLDRTKRVIASWYLPNSGERIALEVVKDKDGFDRPSFDFGHLNLEDFSEVHIGPLEDDQDFFATVIWPQAKDTMKEYFYRRARFNTSIAKLLREDDRRKTRLKKVPKPSKVKQ